MKYYYGYNEFQNDTRKLLERLTTQKYDAIVAIARGGMTLAHCLAEGMNIRDVQSVRTELYDGSEKREKITLFGNCELQKYQRVLVVDDIADSGETLHVTMQHLQAEFPQITFESATLFYKETSVYEPTFWIQKADKWIDFFWEADYISR